MKCSMYINETNMFSQINYNVNFLTLTFLNIYYLDGFYWAQGNMVIG